MSMPTRPTTEPTLRSMPPVMMTSVMPSASRPYSEVCRNISTMEFAVVKFGAQNEKKITSMMRAMNVRPLSRIMPRELFLTVLPAIVSLLPCLSCQCADWRPKPEPGRLP